jgi:C-terminal processing protease CtpA/Prc
VQKDFSISNIKANYIPGLKTVDTSLHYGIAADNIGYIHFGEFGMPVKFYQQQMATIMPALANTRGLVIDIRNHAGGDDEVSRFIAGWFAAEKKLFMTVRKRNGRGRNDFTSPQSWYTDPQTGTPYTKPICVLTTRWTTSAGETFTWALNTQSHVTHMGDTTAGGFSDVVSRELPNGWLYFVSVGDYRNATGQSEEGKGIAPAIRIINLPEEVAAGKDKVLEAALQHLR